MNKQSVVEIIKERLTDTNIVMSDQQIESLATKIMYVGEVRMV
jgi:hypothetical protein